MLDLCLHASIYICICVQNCANMKQCPYMRANGFSFMYLKSWTSALSILSAYQYIHMLFQIYPLVNCKLDPDASALRDQVLGPYVDGFLGGPKTVDPNPWWLRGYENVLNIQFIHCKPPILVWPSAKFSKYNYPMHAHAQSSPLKGRLCSQDIGMTGFSRLLVQFKIVQMENGHESMVLQWTNQSRISVSFCQFRFQGFHDKDRMGARSRMSPSQMLATASVGLTCRILDAKGEWWVRGPWFKLP
jgi:hypothetical protein